MFNLDPDPHRISRADLLDEDPRDRRKRLLAKNNGLCLYCDNPGTTLDHIIPKRSGLPFVNQDWNLYPCCESCNSSKGPDPWRNFFRRSRHYCPSKEQLIYAIITEHLTETCRKNRWIR